MLSSQKENFTSKAVIFKISHRRGLRLFCFWLKTFFLLIKHGAISVQGADPRTTRTRATLRKQNADIFDYADLVHLSKLQYFT